MRSRYTAAALAVQCCACKYGEPPRSVCLENTVLGYSTAYLNFWQRSVAAEAGKLHLQCGLRRCLSLRSPPHLQRSPRRRSHEAYRLYGSAKKTCLAEPRQSVRKQLCNGVRTCAYRPEDRSTCKHFSLGRSLPVPAFPVKNTFLCSSHTSRSTCFCRTKGRGQALCSPDSSMAVGNYMVASGQEDCGKAASATVPARRRARGWRPRHV